MFKNLVIYLLLFVLSFGAFGLDVRISGSHCGLIFQDPITLEGTRSPQKIKELNFGTYNVLNLEVSPGKYVFDEVSGQRVFRPGEIKKPDWQLAEVAKAIKAENLDIVVLQEVEGLVPLKKLNRQYFDNSYKEILIPGNDGRGIEIGFLVKKDLPFKIHVETHKEISWVDPNRLDLKEQKLFSRDVPVLHIRLQETSNLDPPDFIVMGTHYKSQRDRAGDVGSAFLRQKQVEKTLEIVEFYQKQYGDNIPIILAGDFNGDIHRNPEFQALFKSKVFQDSFDLLPRKLTPMERVTHTYHPRDEATVYSQLDGVLVSKGAGRAIKDAKVHRYLDENGKPKPLPNTWDERELNPSDHYLLKTVFDFQRLLFR